MPSRNEIQEYKLLTDEAVRAHRLMMERGKLPRPGGAFDVMPEWMKVYTRMSPKQRVEMKRQVLLALDDTEVPGGYRAIDKSFARGARDEESGAAAGEPDPEVIAAILKAVGDRNGGDHGEMMQLLDSIWPGCCGAMAEDDETAVPPFPGRPSVGGAPLPLGKSLGQDAAMRRSVDARMRAADASQYEARWGNLTNRIKLDPTPGAR